MEEYSPQAKRLLSVLQVTTAWISGFLVSKPKQQKHRFRHSIEKFLNSPEKSRQFYHYRLRKKKQALRAAPKNIPPVRIPLCSQEEYYQLCKKVEKRSKPKRVRYMRNSRRAREQKQIEQNYTSILANFERANPHYGRKEEVKYTDISYYGNPLQFRDYVTSRANNQIHLLKFNYVTYKRLRRCGLRQVTTQDVIEKVTPHEARLATVSVKNLLCTSEYEKAINSKPPLGSIVWKWVRPVVPAPVKQKSICFDLPSDKDIQDEVNMHIKNKIRAQGFVNDFKPISPPVRLYANETERQAAKRARSKINKNI